MVTFTTCPNESLPAMLKFFGAMYWPDYVLATSEPLFRWQFGGAGTAVNGKLALRVALVDNEIAGCVGYIPVPVQIDGEMLRGAWAANWVVDQKYRRLGLGPLLIRDLVAQFDVTLALGGNRDAHDLLPRMGWTDFGDLPRYVCVIDPEAVAPLTESATLAWPSHMKAKALEHTHAGKVVKIDSFTDDASDVWDHVFGHVAGTRRSAAFLNWRYADHPVFEYRLFASYDGASLKGFGVYRIEKVRDFSARIGRIVELVAPDAHAVALLRAFVQDGLAQDVSAFDFFCSAPQIAPAMREVGFMPGSEEPASAIPMLFQPVDRTRTGILFMARVPKTSGARALNDWYVTSADGDQDRPA